MLIQHVLTEDIFMTVFDEPQFHRDNAIAHKLQEVVATFYRAGTQRRIHARIAPYYETINARAAQISNHHEKQKFLKAVYGSFYRAYNPKAADRLGIIYTPDEIVRFKIEAVDYLVFKHFGKTLGDQGVEILDPVVGTGTYVTELIDYLPPEQLRSKYLHEIHCNEVAILPYYIASLNIEYTYKQRTGEYLPFENICFVDTLDNLGFKSAAPQMDFFGLVDENAERIVRQNKRRISVIIGNPPYNANQANENENNKNRDVPRNRPPHQGDLHPAQHRAEDRRCTTCTPVSCAGPATASTKTASSPSSPTAPSLTPAPLMASARSWQTSSATSMSWIWAATSATIPSCRARRTTSSGFRPASPSCFWSRSRPTGPVPDFLRPPSLKWNWRETNSSSCGRRSSPKSSLSAIHPDEHHNWLHLTENDWDELIPVASKEAKVAKADRTRRSSSYSHLGNDAIAMNGSMMIIEDGP